MAEIDQMGEKSSKNCKSGHVKQAQLQLPVKIQPPMITSYLT
jgi:hypothetical protein